MPVKLEGSCRCGAVSFTVDSHTPYPFMRCYCSICRKISGGGGHTINIMGVAETLAIKGEGSIEKVQVEKDGKRSDMSRSFCKACSTALWGWHPAYPELLHPFASAIDSELPIPPSTTHIMLGSKASWVQPAIADGDKCFDAYPDESIEDWHRNHNLWID